MKINPGNQFCIPTNLNLPRLIHKLFFIINVWSKKKYAANESHIRFEKMFLKGKKRNANKIKIILCL